MPNLEILLWIANAILGGFAWFYKREIGRIDTRLDRLETDLNQVRNSYLHKDDFKEFKQELKSMFEEIKQDIRQINHK
jgi:hypothetical protein